MKLCFSIFCIYFIIPYFPWYTSNSSYCR